MKRRNLLGGIVVGCFLFVFLVLPWLFAIGWSKAG